MESSEDPTTYNRVIAKFNELALPYKLTVHQPVLTSQEAADVRGVSLDSGAKAMLIKSGDRFLLAVMSASRKFGSKKFKKVAGVKNIKFASNEEVLQITGCLSGAVPPFGSLFNTETLTYIDNSLANNEFINFNCGLRTHSVQISFADYQRIETHPLCDFCE